MNLFEKLKIKELLEKDHVWEIYQMNDYRNMIQFRIDGNNILTIKFHLYLIPIFSHIDIKIKNYNDNNEFLMNSVEKTLYLTKNMKLIRKLNKIRKTLLRKEKEKDELRELRNSIKHLPKSMARELNIDKILD